MWILLLVGSAMICGLVYLLPPKLPVPQKQELTECISERNELERGLIYCEHQLKQRFGK